MSFTGYASVPKVYPAVGDRRRIPFDRTFIEATTSERNILILGDSTVTNPSGRGTTMIPVLQSLMVALFGNRPSTELVGAYIGCGGGRPPGYFGLTGNGALNTLASVAYAGVDGARSLPPGLVPRLIQGETINFYGPILMLQPDAADVHHGSGCVNCAAWDKNDTVAFEWWAKQANPSAELNWKTYPQDDHIFNFFLVASNAGGDLASGLDAGGGFTFLKKGLTPNLSWNGKKYMQIVMRGNDQTDVKKVEYVGGRYKNISRPWGMSLTAFGASGYRWSNLINDHDLMSEWFQLFDADEVWIFLGANSTLVAQDQFDGAQTIIARYKAWIDPQRSAAGKPPQLYRLFSPWQQKTLTAPQQAEFDQFSGAYYAVALADPRVMAVNLRYAMELMGLTTAAEDTTGLTDKGFWASGTAYVVNDMVQVGYESQGGIWRWKCRVNHTAADLNRPGQYSSDPATDDSHNNWTPVNSFLADDVHLTAWGQRLAAQMIFSAVDPATMPPPRGSLSLMGVGS